MAERKSREQAKGKMKKTERAKLAKGKAKKAEKVKPTREKAKKAKPTEGVELYRGRVALKIVPPIDFAQLDGLKKALFEVKNLRVVVVAGAAGEGIQILVSAEEPLPLLNILRGVPVVAGVARKGGEIQVSLKAR